MFEPKTIEEASGIVGSNDSIIPAGGRSKYPAGETVPEPNFSTSGLSGIIEYEPSEYTITALAGTPLHQINKALAENNQYLPFDPPLVRHNATLGGTIASGLSGPGRLRYGGLRDFLIGIRFIDGAGKVLQGGGKVVKNAAGFDYPKLLCGSKGSLGVIVEATFKVFPRMPASRTLLLTFKKLEDALDALIGITLSNWEPDALELNPVHNQILLRLCGNSDALDKRLPAIQKHFAESETNAQLLKDAQAIWEGLNEYAWCPKHATLLKIPTTPARIPDLEYQLSRITEHRRYSMAGNLALVALSPNQDKPKADIPATMLQGGISAAMDELLAPSDPIQAFSELGLDADHILGPSFPNPGPHPSNTHPIHHRIKQNFDHLNKFPPRN